MAHYLENLFYMKRNYEDQLEGTIAEVNIDINALKEKDLKEWKPEET